MSDDHLLIGERHLLFLDEAQERGVEKPSTRPDYPPINSEERMVLKVVANGLFLSESSIQWAFYNAQQGNKEAWRRILAILAGKPVKMTIAG